MTADAPFRQKGMASWYGKQFHGNRPASGEIYDMFAMTAAHPTLPIPSYVRVSNPRNGRSVIVRVNDRGPFKSDRIIELSYGAATKLEIASAGTGEVEIERLTSAQIASGDWRRGTNQAAREATPMGSVASAPGPGAGGAATSTSSRRWRARLSGSGHQPRPHGCANRGDVRNRDGLRARHPLLGGRRRAAGNGRGHPARSCR